MFTATKKHSIGILLVLSTPVTLAQVVLDGTLGKPGNLTGPTFAISADLGQQQGGNLFHSFQTFNLQSGETATFSGPASVTNVISRVTGGQSSYVNGTLQLTIPQANFYFLNPAGVMFGATAKLDVPGSFYVSTANYLRLADNGRFDASEPARSVLTVAPPAAFGFLTESPGKIESKESSLSVFPGKKLSWIGGDLTIRNSHLTVERTVKLADGRLAWFSGGGINLVSVAAVGEVPVTPEELAEDTFSKFGHISIADDTVGEANQLRRIANVDASGFGGGKIYIRGGQITLDNGYVFADTWGNLAGQEIWVKAQEKLTMQNGARITTETPNNINVKKDNTGKAGNIQIEARQLSLSDGSQIVSSTNTAGAAGDVTVTATESIEARGQQQSTIDGTHATFDSGLQSRSWQSGHGGQITMSAPLITLSNGGVILTLTQGRGDAGNVTVQTDKLVLESGGHISVSAKFPVGDKDFNKTGNAGNISITASQSVLISGRPTQSNPSGLRSNVFTAGKGGQITVKTPVLTVQDRGSIESGTEWRGDGGQIVLNTSQLTVRRGGIITAESMLSQSKRVANETEKESADFYKVCDSQWCGKAGNITIHTDYLTLQQGNIKTAAHLSGGGNICLHVNRLLYVGPDSEISALARGIREGDDGGNLTIKPPTFVIFAQQSTLNTSAYAGRGGNITVVADNYLKAADKVVIDASSEKNLPGEISISATQEDFIGLLSFSPQRYSTTTKLVRHSCGRGKKKNQYQNTFQVILQEMLHPAPSDLRFFSPAM